MTNYNKAVAFFKEWAGCSYTPGKETLAQGALRGARALASAELWADRHGYVFDWQVDNVDSSEWSEERPAWPQWVCCMKLDGRCVQSLHCIDFGRDGYPGWDGPYTRVVEAELALEQMP